MKKVLSFLLSMIVIVGVGFSNPPVLEEKGYNLENVVQMDNELFTVNDVEVKGYNYTLKDYGNTVEVPVPIPNHKSYDIELLGNMIEGENTIRLNIMSSPTFTYNNLYETFKEPYHKNKYIYIGNKARNKCNCNKEMV